ncbi:beta-galactosidase-1-like protein [Pelobates fuscus]|uniref:beta-galactosidase-1-like protein n=1 Tax=Pelobates fuscus TaxID=191477 RepID=UPI002FE447DC
MGARLLCLLLLGLLYEQPRGDRSFTIDDDQNCFKKDGVCFHYISGSIHYFRIPTMYWKDRLMKMYMTGLNAIQIYVPWNFHEPEPGMFNFEGDRALEHFLDLANETGLLVIIRPGPYICSEWDMGGLPAWLLNKKDIVLRTSDPDYLSAVNSWLSVLLPRLRPRLYNNGGNIISVQVENEYGSYQACDYSYMRHLFHTFRLYLGDDVVLFTTDGNTDRELKCGSLQGMQATVDFGPADDAKKAFDLLRRYQPTGPLVNSEYYTGWLDYWGENHSTVSTQMVSHGLQTILEMGANVNMYMFEGGTNFGYWNGADYKKQYKPITTSYDYDAPLTEAGDPTEKLFALRSVISQFLPVPAGPMPPPTPKYDYGVVKLQKVGDITDFLDILCPGGPIVTRYPITFEDAKQYFGFMLYRTRVPWEIPDMTTLSDPFNSVHDRAYITIDGSFTGVLERDHVRMINVTGSAGDWLDILVENMGRINFGSLVNDLKGLVSNLTLGGDILTDWLVYPLNIDGLIAENWPHMHRNHIIMAAQPESRTGPAVYTGTLKTAVTGDTFLKLFKWTKGQVWINGFNIGRYWPDRGPQVTLYVPGNILSNREMNNITVLELESAPEILLIFLIDRPIISKNDHGF